MTIVEAYPVVEKPVITLIDLLSVDSPVVLNFWATLVFFIGSLAITVIFFLIIYFFIMKMVELRNNNIRYIIKKELETKNKNKKKR